MPFLFFLLLPLLELVVFIQVGARLGVLAVLAFIFLSGLIGVVVLRNYSVFAVIQAQRKIMRGQLPYQELGQSIWLAFAGLLFIIPGFISSTCAVLLLLPITRRFLGRWLQTKTAFQHSVVHPPIKEVDDVVVVEKYRITTLKQSDEGGQVIEGEFKKK